MKLTGKKCVLRTLRESDADNIVKNVQSDDIFAMTTIEPPYDTKKALDFIAYATKNEKEKKSFEITIAHPETDEVMGMIGLMQIDWKNKNAEIGYWLGKSFRGQGIMKEAISLMLRFAFEELDFMRVWAYVFTQNTASAKLLENMGFQKEGYLRKNMLKQGKWMDDYLYAIIKDDWSVSSRL